MNFSLFIATRYFFSKRKKNFINVISILSMAGVAFSTAALIIVLSVFNGLEDLLSSLYTSFDPQFKIESTRGKTFQVSGELTTKIKAIPGVEIVTEVIEDYAYVKYRDAAMPATVRGVSENFIDQKRLDKHIVDGELLFHKNTIPFAIIGAGVQSTLSVALEDDLYALQIYYIRNVSSPTLDPSQMYSRMSIRPGGVFSIEKTYDENYIFLPLAFVRDLFDYGTKRTFLEIKTSSGANIKRVQRELQQELGSEFKVLSNQEQHQDLYRLLRIEKLFTFLSLSLLVVVGSINIFFSLMMLAIDKKKDITILFALGAYPKLIKRIFLSEGAIIALIGAFTGLLIGGIVCWLQDYFGLVGMGMENAIVSSYPVKMRISDFLATSVLVILVTFLTSYYPAAVSSRSYSTQDL